MKYNYYDNTRVSCMKTCPRKYYFRHRRDWVREGKKAALTFGLAWHAAMDVVWDQAKSSLSDLSLAQLAMISFMQTWTDEGFPSQEEWSPELDTYYAPRTPGIAHEMLIAYISQRRDFIRDVEVLSIEQPFAVPLDDSTFYIGRLDKVFRMKGKVIVAEHKTTSLYKKDGPFRDSYLESWSPKGQIDGYIHAIHMLYGEEAHAVWIDAALVHKKIHDGFKFIPVMRQTSQLDAWLYETQHNIMRIEQEIEAEEDQKDQKLLDSSMKLESLKYLRAWPKNDTSCDDFAGCSYRELCKMLPNPMNVEEPPLGFKCDHWEPFDVLGIEKLALEDK